MESAIRWRVSATKIFLWLTYDNPTVRTADIINFDAGTAIFAFGGFVVWLPDPVERGMIKAIGMGLKSTVEPSQYMEDAYNLGKTI